MKKRNKPGFIFMAVCAFAVAAVFAFTALPLCAASPETTEDNELTVLFTHDIHDYLYPTVTVKADGKVEHGGAAKLVTLVKQYAGENTLYLDAGDFSMGTLYQAAYATDAYELRNLGITGCAVTTFGNHEFDFGCEGVASMLEAAMKSGDKLPLIVQSNIDFSGELTEEQQKMKDAFEEYGVAENVVLEKAGYKIGIFGIMGYDGIDCTQADISFTDYIEAARNSVQELEAAGCDVIIALSHAGTDGDGVNGEDFVLAEKVDGIDLIISGHSHTVYEEPVTVNGTVVVSCGEYLQYLGKLTLSVENGAVKLGDYELIPLDSSVAEDKETLKRMDEYKTAINEGYLKDLNSGFDDVICYNSYDFPCLDDMYATHQEYPLGDLIADSYLNEAKRCGIDDIDVAIVGLGTIRGSLKKGEVTVADVFEICSLGVGRDGTAGHPLAAAYITGKELRLITELDASLGPMVSYIKMSYSGLEYSFNPKRVLLDRVTSVHLVRDVRTTEKIDDNRRYKIVTNMYSINMLGMLNGLTKGILSITPTYADGTPIEDYYDVCLRDQNGNEVKEWMAFENYLATFEKGETGLPQIPVSYGGPRGRKNISTDGSLKARFSHGQGTDIFVYVNIAVVVLIVLIILLVIAIRKAHIKRKAKKQDLAR